MRNKFLIISTLLIALLVGCNNNDEPVSNSNNTGVRVVAVETMVVQPRDFQETVRLTGTVESMEDAVISAEASGRVQEILRRGAEVQEGDVLAQLDETLLRVAVDVARSSYEVAQETFERQQPLYEEEIITPLEFSGVRAQRDQARAQLRQAERQLENATILAPFNGRVEERMVDRGELLNPGNPVVRLVNTDRIRVTAGVPERYANQVRVGTDVMVSLRAYNAGERRSQISFAGNVINPQTRTFPVEIELDNPDQSMKPQMTVEVLVTRSHLDNVISIPRTALIRDEGGQNVFVVNRQGERPVAEFRPVVTGGNSAGNMLILEGLFAGDEVIVAGLTNLNAGDIVRVEESPN